jgi:hypothetical protein
MRGARQDITDSKAMEEQLQYKDDHDSSPASSTAAASPGALDHAPLHAAPRDADRKSER